MSEETPSCTWTEDSDGLWTSECGRAFVFDSGVPTENSFAHCPFCGQSLHESPHFMETRVCRECGCTEHNACEDSRSPTGTCWWVEGDLCSACQAKDAAP